MSAGDHPAEGRARVAGKRLPAGGPAWAAVLFLAVALVAVGPVAPAAAHESGTATLHVSPRTAAPGEEVTVTGHGYERPTAIRMNSPDGTVLATMTPQAGWIKGAVRLPGGVHAGPVTLLADPGSEGHAARADVSVRGGSASVTGAVRRRGAPVALLLLGVAALVLAASDGAMARSRHRGRARTLQRGGWRRFVGRFPCRRRPRRQTGLRTRALLLLASFVSSSLALTTPAADASTLAIDRTVSADGAGPVTTASFDTSGPDQLLVAFVSSDGPAGTPMTFSVTGAGLTWRLAQRTNVQWGGTEVWSAYAPNTVTGGRVTSTPGTGGYFQSLTVLAFTGASGIGATASANASTGPPSIAVTTTAAGSRAFAVGNDWDGAVARTLPAGQVMVRETVQAGAGTFWVQSTTGPTPDSGTQVILNATAPTTNRWNFTAVEVMPAPTSGGPPAIGSVTATNVTTTGASIRWTTDKPATSRVEYGTTSAYGSTTALDTALVTSHRQDLTGLVPGTLYHYRVHSADADGLASVSGDFTFTSSDVTTVGQFSGLTDWPLVAIHSSVLPNGEVLVWDEEFGATIARVWHPGSQTFTDVPTPSTLFCAAQVQLPDGRLMVIGGGISEAGVKDVNIFDPAARTWTRIADLNVARWYPSATLLPDGRVVVVSGQITPDVWADTPEVYDPATGKWTLLTQISTSDVREEEYPLSFLLPDGRVFIYGASTGRTRILDVAARTWTPGPTSPVVNGSATMYSPGKILASGGAPFGATAQPTSAVIDLNAPSPAWRTVGSMAYGRYMHNLVVLPDGRVLAVGGSTVAEQKATTAVLEAEAWSPATESWQIMASMSTPRMYHSTAVLLLDGRVLVAGGGRLPPAVDYPSAEIYSPPYLFQGGRPSISGVSGSATHGGSVTVQTPDAAGVAAVRLLSLAAQTHSLDMAQHAVDLAFTAASGAIDVVMPSNPNAAPPGPYMVVLVNGAGVPSAASVIRLSSAGSSPPPPPVISNVAATAITGTSATITWTTDTPATSEVEYGATTAYGSKTPVDPALVTSHSQVLDGLSPGTTYHYRVTSRSSDGATSTSGDHTFTSSPGEPPARAIAIDRRITKDGNGKVTTGPFGTSEPHQLLVAFVSSDGPVGSPMLSSVSGGGLDWTLVRRTNTQAGTAEVWSAHAASVVNDVRVTATPSIDGYFQSLTVVSFTAARGVGASAGASAGTGAPAVTLTTTGPGSWVFSVGADWKSAASRTPGPDQTIVYERTRPVGTFWVQSTTAATESPRTEVTMNDVAPTANPWNFTAIEVMRMT
jgi:hypothetical protein